MRDPNRIDEFCDALKEVWKNEVPDWRFFQLVNNVMRAHSSDLFYIEDDKAIECIKNIFK